MSTAYNQPALEGMDKIARRETLTPLDLLQVALNNNSAIDVIERLADLQRQEREREAEIQFTEAMNAAQSEMGRVAPNLDNSQTKSKYASYSALDKALRPIYAKHGFCLSFTTEDSEPETVKVLCYVSHVGGYTRAYRALMPADGKGAKGGDVMTKTHATGAAMSYGMRYLLKMIFNVAVGEDDTDGNLSNSEVAGYLGKMEKARTPDELRTVYQESFKDASKKQAYKSLAIITQKYDKLKGEFNARD